MIRLSTRTKRTDIGQRAFTLLELLIVVAVIATLMSITVVVMSGVTDQARAAATRVTVTKIHRLLEQRINAFDRAYKGPRENAFITGIIGLLATDPPTGAGVYFQQFLTNPQDAPPYVKTLARKAAMRFEFPQNPSDLNDYGGDSDGDGIPDLIYSRLLIPRASVAVNQDGIASNDPGFASAVTAKITEWWNIHMAQESSVFSTTGGTSSTGSSEGVHSTESSEFLYFTLISSGSFGSTSSNLDDFTSEEIADTDGDGMPEFIDAWGNPLRFYRWPTRLVDPDAPSPFMPSFTTPNDSTEVDLTPNDASDGDLRRVTGFERELAEVILRGLPPTPTPLGTSTPRDVLLIDPDDPAGFLYSFLEDPNLMAMGAVVFNEVNETNYHTPDTYHAPLIISAGSDGLLGLREPNDVDGPAGIFGNLAQYAGTAVPTPNPNVVPGVVDSLFDNISNRNIRAGARR